MSERRTTGTAQARTPLLPQQRTGDRAEAGPAAPRAATARALARLPEGWCVLQDLLVPDGGGPATVTHLVVGPSGVVVVDSPWLAGRVEVVDGEMWQGGRRRPDPFPATRRRAEVVRRWAGLAPHLVSPAVSVDGHGQLEARLDGLVLADPDSLRRHLLTRPRVWDAERTARVAEDFLRVAPASPRQDGEPRRRTPATGAVAAVAGLTTATLAAGLVAHGVGGRASVEERAAWGEEVVLSSQGRVLEVRVPEPRRAGPEDRGLWRSRVLLVNGGEERVRLDSLAWTMRARTDDQGGTAVRVARDARGDDVLEPGESARLGVVWQAPAGATPTSVVLRDHRAAARWGG